MIPTKRKKWYLPWGVALLLICSSSRSGLASDGASNKAKVSLLPSVDGISAGVPLELGLLFELEPPWHIYWKNSGDSGLPPTVQWTIPEGFAAGELQFPIPKRLMSPGDITTNIHAGEPMLIAPVTPPPTMSGPTVQLAAKVVYLVCADKCLREEAEVAVDLPVLDAGVAPKPANRAEFDRARRMQPKSSSKHLAITPTVSATSLRSGDSFTLALKVAIGPGLHIQSHQPTLPQLIPADVFLEKTPGLRFGKPKFPTPKLRKDKYLGSLTEFEGTIDVIVPATADDSWNPGPAKIAGVFTYQACNDKGNCFPPDALAFSLSVGEKRADAGHPPEPGAGSLTGAGAMDASARSDSRDQIETASLADRAPQGAVDVGNNIGAATPMERPGFEGALRRWGLAGLLIGCFLYGLFINATPCVLPILSIKVLGFVQQAHESRRRTAFLGMAFGAGVIVFFVILGLLAAAGTNILQFPAAVIGLGTVVTAMGLSMLGVFTLQPPTAAVTLESKISKEGPLSSFGKGALAPILGFACTGPLLAGAFGWATQQPSHIAVLAFLFAGLGMAFPYVLLGFNPRWLSFLPKPGDWMVAFERIMGFLLLAMVIWLLHPLVTQIGSEGLEWTLVFLIFVGLACWILGRVRFDMSATRRWTYRGAAIGLVVLVGGVIYEGIFPLHEAVAAARAQREALANCANGEAPDAAEIAWRPWSPKAVMETVQAGKLAFVDFTAAYCTVCKVNKAVAIDTPEFVSRLKALGGAAFQGDFTTGDDAIFQVLKKFERAGVPLNLIYPPGQPDSPLVLEPNLSKSYLLQKLDEAAAVRSASAVRLGT